MARKARNKYTNVYKVVISAGTGVWKSAIVYDPKVACEYVVGKTTRPKVGLLFAFRTKKDAFDFASSVDANRVYLAKAKVSETNPEYLADICGENVWRKVVSFWRRKFGTVGDVRPGIAWPVPHGTVFCESIRLLRRV